MDENFGMRLIKLYKKLSSSNSYFVTPWFVLEMQLIRVCQRTTEERRKRNTEKRTGYKR